ncbi:hypothetical protein [Mycoplasmopsis verecunda]|uniref:Transglutaminase-like domain-containing protein n=1 Tax=Mycoplasmopsis verecunda TaxID=171291 RepID=A0A1T4KJ49_9BACT|nr:hypothetical protein [Mycoplasmopsis verecunda]WPB54242.1 hypothetical protein SAM46_02020 [Mycoplasmopsis verecunda]SJZ42439.1 hypothetical protein SAMN02745154_00062 [Mycoplasmopsis verecunda]
MKKLLWPLCILASALPIIATQCNHKADDIVPKKDPDENQRIILIRKYNDYYQQLREISNNYSNNKPFSKQYAIGKLNNKNQDIDFLQLSDINKLIEKIEAVIKLLTSDTFNEINEQLALVNSLLTKEFESLINNPNVIVEISSKINELKTLTNNLNQLSQTYQNTDNDKTQLSEFIIKSNKLIQQINETSEKLKKYYREFNNHLKELNELKDKYLKESNKNHFTTQYLLGQINKFSVFNLTEKSMNEISIFLEEIKKVQHNLASDELLKIDKLWNNVSELISKYQNNVKYTEVESELQNITNYLNNLNYESDLDFNQIRNDVTNKYEQILASIEKTETEDSKEPSSETSYNPNQMVSDDPTEKPNDDNNSSSDFEDKKQENESDSNSNNNDLQTSDSTQQNQNDNKQSAPTNIQNDNKKDDEINNPTSSDEITSEEKDDNTVNPISSDKQQSKSDSKNNNPTSDNNNNENNVPNNSTSESNNEVLQPTDGEIENPNNISTEPISHPDKKTDTNISLTHSKDNKTESKDSSEINKQLDDDIASKPSDISNDEKNQDQNNNTNDKELFDTGNDRNKKPDASLSENTLNDNSESKPKDNNKDNESKVISKPIQPTFDISQSFLKDLTLTDSEINILNIINNSNMNFYNPPISVSKYSTFINPKDKINSSIDTNWGDVPLVKKSDDKITHEDLIEMMTYIIGTNKQTTFSFGNRKISSNLLANAYNIWFRKYWKYFPSFSVSNLALRFVMSDDKQYVKSIEKPLYVFDWQGNSTFFESLDSFINDGLNLIKPGMNDYDKALVLWRYVMYYLDYNLKDVLIPANLAVLYRTGVCATYAHLYSLMLNFAGIEAFPMITGQDVEGVELNQETHEVAYLKLQLPGHNKAMWFASDPTYAKGNDASLRYKNSQLAYTPKNEISFTSFLFPVSKSYNEPLIDVQYHSRKFFDLDWHDFFNSRNDNNEYFTASDIFKIDDENHKVISPVFKKGFMYDYLLRRQQGIKSDERSSFEFWKGKYYSLATRINKDNNIEKVLLSQDLNSDTPNVVDWYSLFYDQNIISDITLSMVSNNPTRLYNLLTSYQDKLIFIGRNFNYKNRANPKVFYVLNENNEVINIEIPDSGNKLITNFYATRDGIFYDFNYENKYHKLLLNDEQLKFYNTFSQSYEHNLMINNWKWMQIRINSFETGSSNGQISFQDKVEFNKTVDYAILNYQNKDFDFNAYNELITKSYEYLVNNATNINQLIIGDFLRDAKLPKDNFIKHGLTLSPILYENLSQITHYKTSLVYVDVLASQDNNNFETIMQNQPIDRLKLTSDVITNDLTYIKLRYKYNKDTKLNDYYESNVFKLDLSTDKFGDDNKLKLYLNGTYLNSNYANKNNWMQTDITLQLPLLSNQDIVKNNYKLYHIDSNNKITSIDIDSNLIHIGKISKENKGVYVVAGNNQMSNFFFALNQDDIANPQQSAYWAKVLKDLANSSIKLK